MANSRIQTYADMVNLQVAAEAFWSRLSSPMALTITDVLTDGNKNNSKEPTAVADLFKASAGVESRYKLIAHQDLSLNATTVSELGTATVANKSGFSASIFFDTVKNEYTLSIRSTEFADSIFDGGDIQANLDIGLRGWAFAQVSSMEAFWSAIVNGDAANGVNATTVPDAAALAQFRSYLTDGVGKVNVTGYSLGANVAEAFVKIHRAQVAQAYFFNGAGTGVPVAGNSFVNVWTRYQQVYENPLTAFPNWATVESNEVLAEAWQQYTTSPDAIYTNLYNNPRYLLARAAVEPLLKGALAASSLLGSTEDAPRTPDNIVKDIFASAYAGSDVVDTVVGRSGQRHGAIRPIWYEEQPAFLGVPFTEEFDFGLGHSIVLLQDSLNLMAAFEKLDPSISEDRLATLFKSASNKNFDSLEKALDALGNLVGLNTPVNAATADDQYAQVTLRNSFYVRLKEIQDTTAYKALVGKATISLASSNLTTQAKTDFAAFLSLNALSPFVITTANVEAIDALKQANQVLAQAWEADRNARLYGDTTKVFDYSDQWYEDRTAMLVVYARRNTLDVEAIPGRISTDYYDAATDTTVRQRVSGAGANAPANKYAFGGEEADTLTGTDNLQGDHLYGGGGVDSLLGYQGKDRLEGGAGGDFLYGGEGDDTLWGGDGADTYGFDGQFGKDAILDNDGQGQIKIKDQSLGDIKGNGSRTWKSTLADDTVVRLQLLDDARSSTGKKLVISVEGDSSNTITIQNFDLTRAQNTDGQGYLGIKLPKTEVVVRETGSLSAGGAEGKSFWSSLTAKLSDLAGKVSNLFSGSKSFTVDLNQPAKAGDTITLHLALDDSALAKAILGDRKVDANGAVITLEEGQTSVSFALVTEGDVTADISGGLSVTYASEGGQTATSNTWGLNVKDAGETAKTFIGDQRALLWGVDLQPDPVVNEDGSVTQDIIAPGDPRYNTYAWSKTEWAADGTLTGGVAEAGFNDVLYGSSENDKIQGLGGNDALDGRGGNDYIDGGDGADLIAGGAGSDHILGGAGNDVILSATTMVTPERRKPDDPTDPARIVGNVIVNGGPLAMDSAADVIDAGDGDDEVYAGHGDDRIDGGNGTDVLFGLGGDDVLEGGAGNDKLLGDGVTTPATYGSAAEALHGSDFLDGGDGNDTLIGGGKGDVLYGGGGDDDVSGDTSGDLLAGQNHGDDYLDGEDGTDRLWGNGANDTLYGGAGNDKLYGDAKASELEGQFHGNDYLDGEDGDDELVGFGKDDVLYGGTGNDLLYGDAAAFELAGQFHGNDSLDGEDGDDTLVGGGRADTLYGGAGNDQLQGDGRADDLGGEFHGDDYLDGEDGDDILIGDGGSDTLYGGSGNDYLMGDSAAEPGAPNHLSGAFHGDDYLDGGDGNDTLVGDGGTDTLLGGAGNDILLGDNTPDWLAEQFHGNDFVDGGDGDDTLYGGGGDDVLQGGTGNDVLAGEAGADYMDGGVGDDTYLAGAGDTVVDDSNSINTLTLVDGEPLGVTASGADLLLDYGPNGVLTLVGALTGSIRQINGVSTRDWIGTRLGTEVSLTTTGENQALLGGMGNDVLAADHAGASLHGAAGDDMLIGGGNFVRMDGGDGNDVLQAGDGGSEMHGGIGGDAIYGGAGNDILDGGAGDDVLTGGDGVDTYLMYYGMGRDKVVDASSEGALIQLASGIPVGNLKLLRSTDNLVLRLGGGNDLELENYFNGNASDWTIRLDDGAQLSLATLVAAMPVIDPENEASIVLQEEAAFLDAVQAKLQQNYLSVIPGYSTPYQMQPDGSLVSQTNIHINEYWGYAVNYRQVESRYFSSGLTTRNTSSTTEKYLLQTDSFPYFYDKTVVKFESSVISSNDAYIVAEETQVTWADTRPAWIKVSWNTPNYSEVQRSSISSTDPFPIVEYGATVGQRVIYQWVDNFYARTSGFTTGVVSFANGSPGTDFRSFGYREETRVEKIQTVNAGDADNVIAANSHTVVNGGAGNDVIQNAGYAYGGDGDDVLVGGGTLRGGSGNDYLVGGEKMEGGLGDDILIGGKTMVASAGYDQIYAGIASAIIEIDPALVENAVLGGDGDSFNFLDTYYRSIGIDNWEDRKNHAGLWHYSLPETANGNGYGAEDEVRAALTNITWRTFEEALAMGWVVYLEPLPPVPVGSANDFQALTPYYESGVLQHHTVQFGAGIAQGDLQFSWSESNVSIDGGVKTEESLHAMLNITWDGDVRGIGVIIPHSDEPFGSGISQFTFADGSTLSMADMLNLAPPAFTFDPHAAIRFEDGSGEIILSGATKVLGFEFDRSELDVSRDGTDLLLAHSDTSDLVRLTDWYGQLGSYLGFKIKFSDGTALTSGDLTTLGLIMDGSAGNQTLMGLDGYANTFIAGPNDILIAGDSGQDTFVFNAGAGTVHIQDSTGTGTIVFGAGITAEQISLGLGSLLIRVGNSGDVIHIDGFDPLDVLDSSGISTFKFSDGEVMTLNELVERGFDIGDSMESGVLSGTNLQDRIVSVSGLDTLAGGAGDDALIAGADANVFVFEAGDGHDLIDETVKLGANAGGDIIRFRAGISVGDMLYAFKGDRLIIMVNGKNNTVSVLGDQAIGRVEFADGSYQTYQSLGAQAALLTTYGSDGSVISALELSHDAGSGVTTGVLTSDAGQIFSRYALTIDADQAAHVDVFDDAGVKTETYTRLYSGTFISGEGWNSTRVDYDDGTAAIHKVGAQGATRLVRLASDGTVISDDLLNYEVADSNLDTVVMDSQSGEVMSGVLHAAVGGHSTLTGTSGLNTFVLGLGNGINVIDDSASSLADGGDSIRFGVGIRAEDVRIDQVGSDLLLRYSADDYVVVRGMNLLDMDSPHYISNITFEGSPTASVSIWKGSDDGESGYQISWVSEAGDRRWGYYRGVDGGSSSWEEHLDESGERIYYDGTWRSAHGTVSHYTRSGDTWEESYYEPNDVSSANFDFAGAVYRTSYGKDNEYAIWHEYDASNRLLGHGENHWQSIDFGGVISWTDVFDANGRLLTHDWYDYPHGLMGWDVYGADGSVSKTTRNLWEGGYSVYTDDGHGNVHTVTYDSDGNLVSDNWEHTNAAPLSNADLEDQAVQQGDAFDFQIPEGSFNDPDAGDALTYSATLVDGSPLPDWLAFDPATHKFSGVPPLESAGTYTVTLRVTDSWGAATQQDFTLEVSAPSNSVPLAVADLLTVQADGQISASGNVLANDQDADPADTLSVMDPGTYEGEWGSLLLLADGSYVYSLNADRTELDALGVGQSVQEIFSYSVTDGRDVTSGEMTITIQGSNDAPLVAAQVGERIATEDAAWSYTIPSGTFTDVDSGDVLAYSVTQGNGDALPLWLHFDVQTATLSGTPGNADAGDLAVRITATDLQGVSASQIFNLSIANANDAPVVLLTLAPQAAVEQQPFTYTLPTGVFADIDAGDSLSYTLTQADGSALPAWLTFNATDLTVSGTPTGEAVGGLELLLIATDTAGATATQALHIDVQALPVVSGTTGNNTLNAQATGSILMGLEGNDTLNGNVGGDKLYGGIGADRLYGQSGNDVLDGGEGNDRLEGGAGADQMLGGLGNDTYLVDDAGDQVTELADEGTDTVQSLVDYTLGANLEYLTLTGTAATSGTGNELNNVITGNVAGNTLHGLGGNDTLRGGLEADVLEGGEGNDRLDGGAGADQLAGGAGNDVYVVDEAGDAVTELADEGTDTVQSLVDYTLGANLENLTLTGTAAISGTGNELNNVITGNAAGNVLRGLGGNDTLRGGLEADVLEGGEGNDRLDGGAGADQLAGGAGNDVYVVDEAGDAVTELADEGTDTVQSLVDYTLGANLEYLTLTGTAATSGTGNELNNVITGNVAGNTLHGLGGNDTLRGGLEADTLEGGVGNDRLEGGAGADTYLFARGEGQDVLVETDATAGVEDVLQFGHDITAEQIWLRQVGNSLEISLIGSGDKVTVANWYLGTDRHVELLQLSDGRQLLDTQVQSLVQAMAAFTPPPAGQTTLPESYAATLTPVIAANWQ